MVLKELKLFHMDTQLTDLDYRIEIYCITMQGTLWAMVWQKGQESCLDKTNKKHNDFNLETADWQKEQEG